MDSSSATVMDSDKLSALPPSSPQLNRVRLQSTSLPSFDVPRPSTQRVSAESDRVSLPTFQSVRRALSRLRSSPAHVSRKNSIDEPDSRSPSHSRAASPLRIFHHWSAGRRPHPREEPFLPVDPFLPHSRLPCFPHPDAPTTSHAFCCLPSTRARVFVAYTLPRTLYLHLLLRLPSLYFSRVARIFEDAEVSRPDIQRMIDVCLVPADPPAAPTLSPTPPSHTAFLPFPEDWSPPAVSPALARFKHSWEAFIDSLLREWKTLNVVSALLLSAILTMFQIPSATDDPLIRTAAFLSLLCALMSLSYGCVFIVRFGTMRSMYKASRWAEEARKTDTLIWWNVWVLLAMPAVWLAWSMLLFITAILALVWRTGSTADPPVRAPLAPPAALAARLAVTSVCAAGLAYFAAIVRTLARYGDSAGERGRAPPPPRDEPLETRGRRREVGRTGGRTRREEASGRDAEERLRPVMGLGLTGLGEAEEPDLEKGLVEGP